jgi:hypothetical protein
LREHCPDKSAPECARRYAGRSVALIWQAQVKCRNRLESLK